MNYDACLESPCHPMTTCTDLTPEQETSQGVGFTCSACPTGYDTVQGDCLGKV